MTRGDQPPVRDQAPARTTDRRHRVQPSSVRVEVVDNQIEPALKARKKRLKALRRSAAAEWPER